MSTISEQQERAIIELVDRAHLPHGMGDKANPCSVAAINLALTNELTDKIPECMSEVVGKWIIRIQDSMPDEMRNSQEWKRLLPQAAGTGRFREQERLDIILDWMWGTVLPLLQPLADEGGFGGEWQRMCSERTEGAAGAARDAAGDAVGAARDAARAAVGAAEFAAGAAVEAAEAAAKAAWAAEADYWTQVDPPRLLAKLIAVGV